MEAIGHPTTRQAAAPGGGFVVFRKAREPRMVTAAAQGPGQIPGPRRLALLDPPENGDGGRGGPQRVLEGALAALRSLARTAVDDVGPMGLNDSAAFASGVEELSRTLDYLQLVAAGQLDRVRQEESAGRTDRKSVV